MERYEGESKMCDVALGTTCTPIKLDELMAGETECEGCDTWVCRVCGQDV